MRPATVCRRVFFAAAHLVPVLAVVLLLGLLPAPAAVYDSGIVLPSTTDTRQLRAFLEAVQKKKLDSGIVNFTPYALLLVRESQNALARSDYGPAGIYAEYACRLAPDIVPPYAVRASQLWNEKPPRRGAAVRNLLAALVYSFSPGNIEDLCRLIFENAAALAGSILMAFCCITLLIVIACLPRLYHDVRHALSEAAPPFSVRIMLVILFAVPLVFRLSLMWLCAWALVWLFAYLNRTARQVVTGFFIACIVCLPLLAAAMGFAKFMSHDDTLRLLWKANYGYCDARETAQLESASDARDLREEIYFSLGLVAKRNGSFDLAQKYYEKVLQVNPGNHMAAINLGNVYVAQNKMDEAIQQYENAAAVNSRQAAVAYFNLSRVYQQKFMFSESEDALNNAKRLDLDRISLYLKNYSDNYNRLVIDETIPVSRLWERGYHRFTPYSALVHDLWGCFAGGLPYQNSPFILLALLFFMLYIAGNDRFRIAVRCKFCGDPICRRCQHTTISSMVCIYCNSLLQKQSKLGYGAREKKMADIRRYLNFKKTAGLVLGYAVPGAGHFWAGRSVQGAIGMLIFFFLVLKTLFPLMLEGPWDFLLGPRLYEFGFYGAVLLAYWSGMSYYARKIPAGSMEESLILKIIS